MDSDEKYNDKEIIQLIKNNDSNAFELLFQKYYSGLCKFAFQFLNDSDLCQDAVSEVFYIIWKKREELAINTNVKAYLFTSVKNRSLSILQKQKKHNYNINFEDLEEIVSTEKPQANLELNELEKIVNSIVMELPKKRQIIFRLKRFEGFKYKEIAEILSISVKTVQNQMVEAVKYINSKYFKVNQ